MDASLLIKIDVETGQASRADETIKKMGISSKETTDRILKMTAATIKSEAAVAKFNTEAFRNQIALEKLAKATADKATAEAAAAIATEKAKNASAWAAAELDKLRLSNERARLTIEKLKTATNDAGNATKNQNRNWSDFFANMLNAREGAAGLLGNVLRLGTGAYITMRSVETLGKIVFALPKAMYEASAEMEKSRIQLEALTGSYEAGSLAFSKLAQLSREKGVNFSVSQDVITRLKGFGVENEKLIPLMERFVIATRGDTQAMSRLALVFGQVTQQGRTFGDDMRQIYNTGVPLAKALAEELGVAPSHLREMSKEGKITSEILENALRRITAEGSNLRNAFDAIANKSASGAWDRAFASIRQLLGSAGEASGLTGVMGGVGRELSDTASFFRGAIEVNRFKSGDPYADLISAREYLSVRLKVLQNEDIATMDEAGKRIGNPLYLKNLQKNIDEVSNDIIAVTDKIQSMEKAAKEASRIEREAFLGKNWSLEALGLTPSQMATTGKTVVSGLKTIAPAGEFELADSTGGISTPFQNNLDALLTAVEIYRKTEEEISDKWRIRATTETALFGISSDSILKLEQDLGKAEDIFGSASVEAEYFRDKLKETNKEYEKMKYLVNTFGKEGADTLVNLSKSMKDLAVSSATTALTDMFKSIGEGAFSLSSFDDAVQSLTEQTAQLFINAGLTVIIGGGGSASSIALGLGLLSLGGLAGIWSGAMGDDTKSGYASVSGAPVFNANAMGGAYSSRSLSAYSGGVYNTPQMFAFANGAGVFAEKGYEGILPLTRTSTGKLGVTSVGNNTSNVTVQIIDQSSGNVSVTQTQTTEANGDKVIRATIRDIMKNELASGNMNSSLKSASVMSSGRRRV